MALHVTIQAANQMQRALRLAVGRLNDTKSKMRSTVCTIFDTDARILVDFVRDGSWRRWAVCENESR